MLSKKGGAFEVKRPFEMLRKICPTHYVLIFGKEKVAFSALLARPVKLSFLGFYGYQ